MKTKDMESLARLRAKANKTKARSSQQLVPLCTMVHNTVSK